jgi:D-threonine aldolase
MMNWFEIKNIAEIDTPALLIHKERVNMNIAKTIALVQSKNQLRPHVKTHKMKEITEMMMDAGIQKFKCATIAEAEMLGMAKAKDVLLAYPVLGAKIARFQKLKNAFLETNFSCIIDNFQGAKQLSDSFLNNPIEVYIDVNVGMNRTGVSVGDAPDLFKKCFQLTGINIIGLHGYDGHINDTNLAIRKSDANWAYEKLYFIQCQIKVISGKKIKIVVGGTPTFSLHAFADKEVEASPGTFVFWDEGYGKQMPDFDFLHAGVIATRVISIVNKTTLCLDLGHKSIAAENPLPRIKFLNVDDAKQIAQNEEHLIIEVADTDKYTLGDVWYGVPVHICPTVALYEEVQVIENNEVNTQWKVIARNKKITI